VGSEVRVIDAKLEPKELKNDKFSEDAKINSTPRDK
jgi:hypothetical protein